MPTLQDTHIACIAGYAVAGLRDNYNPSGHRIPGLVIDWLTTSSQHARLVTKFSHRKNYSPEMISVARIGTYFFILPNMKYHLFYIKISTFRVSELLYYKSSIESASNIYIKR